MSIPFYKAFLHPLDASHFFQMDAEDPQELYGVQWFSPEGDRSRIEVPSEILFNERLLVPANNGLHMDNVRQRTQAQIVGGQAYAQLLTEYLNLEVAQLSAPFTGVPMHLNPATKDLPVKTRHALMELAVRITNRVEDYMDEGLRYFDDTINQWLLKEKLRTDLEDNHPLNLLKNIEEDLGYRFAGVMRVISPNHGIFNAIVGILFIFGKIDDDTPSEHVLHAQRRWDTKYFLFDNEIDSKAAEEILGHPLEEGEELKAFQEFGRLFISYFMRAIDNAISAKSYEIVAAQVEDLARITIDRYPELERKPTEATTETVDVQDSGQSEETVPPEVDNEG